MSYSAMDMISLSVGDVKNEISARSRREWQADRETSRLSLSSCP